MNSATRRASKTPLKKAIGYSRDMIVCSAMVYNRLDVYIVARDVPLMSFPIMMSQCRSFASNPKYSIRSYKDGSRMQESRSKVNM